MSVAGGERWVMEWVSIEGILGTRGVSVNPREVGELFQSEGGDGSLVALPNPFERGPR
jgi:hypothetical protein